MSLECSECEADMRGGHLDHCSRHPLNVRIADLERQLAEAQRAAVCSGEEYEVLRLIQFYSRHDPDGSTLIGMFKRLDEIDARKPK